MMTTEEWNDKPRGKEYSAEPEFDANGWCHDMNKAPRDGTPLLLFSSIALAQGRLVKRGGCAVDFWHDPKRDDCGFTGWGKFNQQYWPPTAWRPLPLPPVKEQDQ